MFVVLAVAYFPLFAGEVIYQRDLARWVWPARHFVGDALARGQSPLWNPSQGIGFPTAAEPQYGLFYPPNLVPLVGPVDQMVTWLWFFHLVWGAIGACIVARRFGAAPIAASIAGLAWALSGFTTSTWTTGILLPASAWVPWTSLGFLSIWRARTRAGGVAAAALAPALALLLGELFVAIIAVGTGIAVSVLWRTTIGRTPDASRPATLQTPRRAALMGALAIALAVGVSTVSWLPAVRAAGETERAQPFAQAIAEQLSFEPIRLVELASDVPFVDIFERDPASVQKVFRSPPLAFGVYLGGSVLALVLVSFGRGRRLPWGLLTVALLGLALALGRHTPVHALLRTLVPPLAFMRSPEKYLIIVIPAAAILAALGAHRMCSDPVPQWRRTAVLAALLLALAAAADAAPEGFAAGVRSGALHSAGAVAGIFLTQWLAVRRPTAAAVLLVVCVGLDLGTAAWPLHRSRPAEMIRERPQTALAIDRDRERDDRTTPPRLYRGTRVQTSILRFAESAAQFPTITLNDNTGGLFGIANVPGYEAARSPAFVRLVEKGRASGIELLRLLAVDYALLTVDAERPAPRGGLTPIFDPVPGARLYRVDQPLPRAYLAGAATVASNDDDLSLLLTPEVAGGGRVILSSPADVAGLDGPAGRAGTCRIDVFETDRIEATCASDRPAVAVFVEQYDPGWRVTVDEAPVPLLRANAVARAVAVAPGRHRIVLTFRAPAFAPALAISAVSLVVLAMGLVLPRAWAWARRRARS